MSAPRKRRSKIVSAASLVKKLASMRKRKKVVFTNGCFDIVHAGHVSYLEKARALGDILVVALNSDESVKRLKGPTRPVNRLDARQEVMAALESVDFVTAFEQDTPLELIRKLKPDVLVKGGDWKPEQIVGGADVLEWGGKVKSLPYIEGQSTTAMIERSKF